MVNGESMYWLWKKWTKNYRLQINSNGRNNREIIFMNKTDKKDVCRYLYSNNS